MNDHSELVKDAREATTQLGSYELPTAARVVDIINELADIVEAYDKQPSYDATLKALRVDLDALGRRLHQQPVNAELLAACRICSEVIPRLIAVYCQNETEEWSKVRAADYLAKRAVENWDKLSEECVKASLVAGAVAQIESGDNDFVDADEFKAKAARECPAKLCTYYQTLNGGCPHCGQTQAKGGA